MTARARSAAAVLLAIGAGGMAAAQQPIFVELDGLPTRVFAQQAFHVTVRLGVDRQWLADRAVPLLQQRLDRPFHVVVPWLHEDDVQAASPLPADAAAPAVRIAVGERALPFRAAGERATDGRVFDLLELQCRVVALQPGELVLPAVQVRYAFGTRFQNDFLRGRQPLDRQEASVAGAATIVQVQAVPQPAPVGYFGAIGTFTLRAVLTAPPGEVGVAQVCSLVLAGNGNFERMAAPATLTVPGCHVQGITVARSAAGCRFDVDLLPLRPGSTLGPFALVVFDPQLGQFTTLHAEPLAFVVQASKALAQLPPRVRELVAAEAERTAERWSPWWGVVVAAMALLALLAFSRWRAVRRREAIAGSLVERCVEALPQDPALALELFDAWLAQRGGGAAASRGPDWGALVAAGCSAAALAELQQLRGVLDAARYGGVVPTGDAVRAALSRARR